MAKITVSFRLNKSKEDGGVYLVCRHLGSVAVSAIGVTLLPRQWDTARQQVANHPKASALNTYINNKVAGANMRMLDLSEKQRLRSLTARQILSRCLDEADSPVTFMSVMERFVSLKRADKTVEVYRSTQQSLRRFDAKADDKLFEDINTEYLTRYERWMERNGMASANTRGIHLRNIRAVFNFAIDEDLTTFYPFRRFKIKKQETIKRAVPVEVLRKMWDTDERYASLFCLSFALQGINLVDLCKLTRKNIVNGRVNYYRQKTGRLYSVMLTPEAEALIERLKGTRHLIWIADSTPNYKYIESYCNKVLKTYHPGCCYYSARHTFATLCADIGVSKDTISNALGHSMGSEVTAIYIKPNQQAVDDALRKVLDYVTGKE